MGNSQPSYFSPQIFVPSPNTNLKGLINPLGENNCFLNVVIQSLWHLDSFSTPPLSLSLLFLPSHFLGSCSRSCVACCVAACRHAPMVVHFSVSACP
jgi:uncharacterized UBP type Zn finger protein